MKKLDLYLDRRSHRLALRHVGHQFRFLWMSIWWGPKHVEIPPAFIFQYGFISLEGCEGVNKTSIANREDVNAEIDT